MYEKADKAISILNKYIIDTYSQFSHLSYVDELHVLAKVNSSFEKLHTKITKLYLNLARGVCHQLDGEEDLITYTWLEKEILNWVDPVVGYKFESEYERKKLRLAETLTTSKNSDLVKASKRNLSSMTRHYADTITDKVTLEVYKEKGIKKIRWNTEGDNRVCPICASRDGHIYNINNIPTKPHIGCRCYFTPVE